MIGWLFVGLCVYGLILLINHERKQAKKKREGK